MSCAGLLAILFAIAAGPALAQASVAEPDGYRRQDYRAQARAAGLIHGERRHAIGHAGTASIGLG